MSQPVLVTGNLDKVAFLNQLLGTSLNHQQLDIDEIQASDPAIIAEHKARQAYDMLGKPVLVEDSYMTCRALNGMPGPFIKFFVGPQYKVDILARMLDGFTDRQACVGGVYCYFDGVQAHSFDLRLQGTIAKEPRGQQGYGWDRIFQPDGYDGRTCAEFSQEEFLSIYSQTEGFRSLKTFLELLSKSNNVSS